MYGLKSAKKGGSLQRSGRYWRVECPGNEIYALSLRHHSPHRVPQVYTSTQAKQEVITKFSCVHRFPISTEMGLSHGSALKTSGTKSTLTRHLTQGLLFSWCNLKGLSVSYFYILSLYKRESSIIDTWLQQCGILTKEVLLQLLIKRNQPINPVSDKASVAFKLNLSRALL